MVSRDYACIPQLRALTCKTGRTGVEGDDYARLHMPACRPIARDNRGRGLFATISTRGANWRAMAGATGRVLLLMAILPLATQEEVAEGACSCAVFPVPGTKSIIEHTLQYNVSCDQEGAENCRQLCIALAESVRDKAPMLICEKLNVHVDNLKVAVYVKSCNMALWTLAGLQSTEPICCHEGKAVICDGAMSVIEN
ncbi:PREDICTED: uncharacterized protein LOC105568663 [Vollenhovia emeryi]|uniref:uncharacterized protein LOC105568663 n=1 Tax=Vollenhovia emeryi TaxID=411798 RepID=UPI0005F3A260|nr:PREDICTED: uncharacterized protein LOC105568663 [Vollenhovia emeryi]